MPHTSTLLLVFFVMMSVITVWLPVLEIALWLEPSNSLFLNEMTKVLMSRHSFMKMSDLNLVSFMDDVELAWDYFKKSFLAIIDKHALLEDIEWGAETVLGLIGWKIN